VSAELPLVSVVIPTRNRPDTVEVAIHSVLHQDHPRVEVIVVDDGSEPPYSPAVDDARIRVLRFDQPIGVAAARNRGMQYSTGAFIGLLDDDDWYYPDKIARQLAFLAGHPEYDMVFSRVAIVNENREVIYHLPEDHVHTPAINFAAFNVIHTNSSLFRRDIISKVQFDERMTKYTDMQFYLAATAHCRVAFLEGVAAVWYRQFRPDQITRRGRERNFSNFRLVCLIFQQQIQATRPLRRLYYGRLLVSSIRAVRPLVAIKCALLILGMNSAWLGRL
jgi:glycosyltransferase involved in cell wall biosynthesis